MLSGFFLFENYGEVSRFVLREPALRALLLDAVPRIVAAFGPSAQAVLSVESDPDEDGSPVLLVRVRTGVDVESSLEQLRRFDASWPPAAMSSGQRLVVDVE